MSSLIPTPGALPAALATALAPSGPTLVSATLAAWSAAKEVFDACRAEEDAYEQAVWMPAYNASQAAGGPQIPEDIDARLDKLTDARFDAEDALMVTAAPDLSAVILKMEYTNKRWQDFTGWPDDWWDAVITDLRRFAGGVA